MHSQPTWRDTLRYIYHFTDYERRGLAAYAPEFYNLERVHRLLALLGDPQQSFQAVHIAGTKGKGSTAAMIESVLRAAGYRSALYTSPHLHTFRERIQTEGALIPEAEVIRLVEEMRPLLDQVPGITTFEVMTGLAFAWFAEMEVEWAVLEVGLGGRLDATNVVKPAVAVITSISLDHTAILGDTHAKIAAEKAGIIKPGVPVVSSPQSDEALAVIEATCQQHGAPLTLVGRDWTWEAGEVDLDGQTFVLRRGTQLVGEFWIPLLGGYQLLNATTAVATLSLLERNGVTVPLAALRQGLRAVQWQGRLEVLNRAPVLVADSAHNGDSARKLMAALGELVDFRRLIVVLGASADHVTPALLEALLSGADRAIATQARHPRAAGPPWIQARAAELGFEMELSDGVPHALGLALADAGPDDLICCAGSVFVAAEARVAWFARQGLSLPPSDLT
ncbi:bifunctional folylpolyglutamate synthase/dihydrofolate synthase [Chloroflexota bacterium]